MALRDNLISWWEMEESSGTRVDSHGTNDLGDINTVGVATGKQGNGADFELANTEYLKIAYASQTDLDYAGSADFTYQMWVKPESISATWMQLWDHFNNNKGSQAIINSTKLTFYVPNGSIHTNWQPTVSGGFSAGNWYHLVFQFDGSAQQARIFVNGTVVGAGWTSATFGSPFPTAPIDPTTDFSIGADASAGGSPFDGIIDEFAFWKRILSDTEVADLYNAGAGLSYADTLGTITQSLTANVQVSATTAQKKTFKRTLTSPIKGSATVTLIKTFKRTLTAAMKASGLMAAKKTIRQAITAAIKASATITDVAITTRALLTQVGVAATIGIKSTFKRTLTTQVRVAATITTKKTLYRVMTAAIGATSTLSTKKVFSQILTATVRAASTITRSAVLRTVVLNAIIGVGAKLNEAFYKRKYQAEEEDYIIKYQDTAEEDYKRKY